MIGAIYLTNQPIHQLHSISPLHEVIIDPVYNLAWSPEGNYLAVATNVVDVANQQFAGKLSIYTPQLDLITQLDYQMPVLSVTWGKDGDKLVMTANQQIEIFQWYSPTLTLEQIIDTDGISLFVTGNSNNAMIAVVELIEYEQGYEKFFVNYRVSFWDMQTGEQQSITNLYIQTRTQSKFDPNEINEFTGAVFLNLIEWSEDGSELYAVGSLRNNNNDNNGSLEYLESNQFIVISPQTGEVIRKTDFSYSIEPRTIAVRPRTNIISVSREFAIGNHDTETGEFLYNFHSDFDAVVIKWSRDGRFVFVDGDLETDDEVIGTFDNGDYHSVFSADWHPYRPIIAIGSLTGRLTVEDATQFEGFTASPIANAGESRIVYVGGDLTADVQLDASASVDYDGTITGYEWREGESILSTNIIADVNLPIGIHDIRLTVTDNDNLTDSVIIQIDVQNRP